MLVTEAYARFEHEPQLIKVAESLAHVLRNVTLHIVEDQLLLGDSAAPPKSCPIYPEFSYSWIVNELVSCPCGSGHTTVTTIPTKRKARC